MTASALALRVAEVRAHIEGRPRQPDPDPADELMGLARAMGSEPSSETVWAAHVALTGAYPRAGAVLRATRELAGTGDDRRLERMLSEWRGAMLANPLRDHPARVVSSAVLVDVTGPAGSDLHTGIQRVVRNSATYWAEKPGAVAVVWDGSWCAYRTLTRLEEQRVFRWETHVASDGAQETDDLSDTEVVIPLGCTVLLTEPVDIPACDPLTEMVDAGTNRLVAIGYDVIPIVSGELVHRGMPDRFLSYLHVISRSSRVAAISETAAREFSGYGEILAGHGAAGPEVEAVPLPSPTPSVTAADRPLGHPEVLMVGSYEPRKNHLGLLHAAERLWREGLDFDLHLIGGMSWVQDIHREVDRLIGRGRPIQGHFKLHDDDLAARYSAARFTVFLSFHEGYGLPVVESLEAATPALVSATGSVGEISRPGGCIAIDPADDEAIVTEMRRMLTDDDLILALRRDALERPSTSWQEYADTIWGFLIEGQVGSP